MNSPDRKFFYRAPKPISSRPQSFTGFLYLFSSGNVHFSFSFPSLILVRRNWIFKCRISTASYIKETYIKEAFGDHLSMKDMRIFSCILRWDVAWIFLYLLITSVEHILKRSFKNIRRLYTVQNSKLWIN